MFWVRPWSTSPSATPAAAAADQLARCPLPVFGWPMASGGLPWSLPPDVVQNYAKFASQDHISSRTRIGEALSPAPADRCSDIDYKVDHLRHQSMVSKRREARTPDSATDDRSVPEDAARRTEATSRSSTPRDNWTPSRSPLDGERQVRERDDRRRNSDDSGDVKYEASDLRVASRAFDLNDNDNSRSRCTADKLNLSQARQVIQNDEDFQQSRVEEETGENEGSSRSKRQQASPMAATMGPIMPSLSGVEFWRGNERQLRGNSEEIEDDDDAEAGDCDSPATGDARSSPTSHQLEIKTQRPLGLLAHHGLVSKASSSHLQPPASPDAAKPLLHQQQQFLHPASFMDYAAQYQSLLAARHHKSGSGGDTDKQTPARPRSLSPQSSMHHWTFEEQFKQLYELSPDVERREFLDELFSFMQKRGTPVNRIPIMAKRVLDLYELYRLVVSKGGLVEVINKKLWREITKELNLPSSITSAAFTLRTQYMKYIYPYECDKLKLSTSAELQQAIDGNRREGRRPGYGDYGDGFLASSGLSALASGRQLTSPPPSPRSQDGDDDVSPSSLKYLQVGSDVPPRPRTHLSSPLESRMGGTPVPPLRLAVDQHPLAHHPSLYLSPGTGGHLAPGRPSRPSFADSQRLFFGAAHDRLPSPQPASRPYFPGFSRASPLSLSPKNLATGLSVGAREEQMSEPPVAKRLALEESRLFYPFSLPTAQLKIASRCEGQSESDNSVVVSMEINGIMYQGVLFSHKAAARR